ncbi:recombinase family protein [Lapillicoccus jejuensis]|uniref:DNA invertase Pin-like site-specific DNA recombinase n=1 Tax=Lapillicoccus jejuensis TaxID=402171 RepID=A0A542DVU2_9MICO|nr:recombinase family protein [Lapillicoccus jejuensis]TQJ07207.1 DNA invertase Pin-like site-specific DNA recombinase [Lapillicoccus jejuensis]
MRAAIYVRQSLDKSGEALAVGRQLAECLELVESRGWEVADVYQDNDVSASSGKMRPEWSRLLTDLADGRHDVLVAWHTDRMYRRLRDLVELIDIVEKRRNFKIATVRSSDIDLSTPAGRMSASMLGSVAAYEVQQKGDRQRAANRQRAQDGVVLWSRRPFGFDRDGSTVTVVKAESKEIKAAARKVLKGATLSSIAADLNARGIPTTTGGRWTVTAVRRTLVNPRTAGRVVSRGQDYGATGPKILDAETFDRVGALLRDPARKSAPPSTAVKYLLSGLACCGRDDEPMYATSNPQGVMVYRCQSCYMTRRMDLVDEVVIAVVMSRLTQPDGLGLFDQGGDLVQVRGRLLDLQERRDGLASLLAEGLLTAQAVREQATKLTAEIDVLERRISQADSTTTVARLARAEDVAAAYRRLSLMDQRKVINTLLSVRILPAGKGVRFDPSQVAVQWR